MRNFIREMAAMLLIATLAIAQAVAPGIAQGVSTIPVSITTATKVLTSNDSGTTFLLSRAAGITVTLPAAAGSGRYFRFVVNTTVTSNNDVIQVSSANDFMAGIQWVAQDGGATVNAFETGATDDTCTMDGSTKGGIRGDYIEVWDMVANTGSANTGYWLIEVHSSGTGTEATCFSAAV